MERNGNEIVKYIEPVFHFCVKRLGNRQDAEDLADEIMAHILNGMKKYRIDSLENWVWRIAHNRYARFINMRNKRRELTTDSDFTDMEDDYDFVDTIIVVDEYQQVFTHLHRLSSEYRNIMVDYYIEQLPVKQIAKQYGLTETTVKWRLNISRQKIRAGIGAEKMDKIYKPIHWNTSGCNGGFFNPDTYLHSQAARAICEAAYERPLAIEDISKKTGLPAMYIEDELPRLISGDAIVKSGRKYGTNFIVLRLRDKRIMEPAFAPYIADIAAHFTKLFDGRENEVAAMDFYGSRFTMRRLGFIALPIVLFEKITMIKNNLNMNDGPFPPRLDGGYGWFIVDEQDTETVSAYADNSSLFITGGDSNLMYYFTTSKYINWDMYHNGGIDWIHDNGIVEKAHNGVIPENVLSDDDRVRLLKLNLIVKDGNVYRFNFPVFDRAQYDRFKECFNSADAELDRMLTELIAGIHKTFKAFVPKRLGSQINQWVNGYANKITAFVTEELINRGVLEKPDDEKPLVNGIFYAAGGNVII